MKTLLRLAIAGVTTSPITTAAFAVAAIAFVGLLWEAPRSTLCLLVPLALLYWRSKHES